jgi:hypothetical protein
MQFSRRMWKIEPCGFLHSIRRNEIYKTQALDLIYLQRLARYFWFYFKLLDVRADYYLFMSSWRGPVAPPLTVAPPHYWQFTSFWTVCSEGGKVSWGPASDLLFLFSWSVCRELACSEIHPKSCIICKVVVFVVLQQVQTWMAAAYRSFQCLRRLSRRYFLRISEMKWNVTWKGPAIN